MKESKRSADKLKLMEFCIDNIGDAIYWLTMDGRFWNVNAAACEMLGYSREELLSLSVFDIDHDYVNADIESDSEKLKRAGSLRLKRFHMAKDGCIIPVEIKSNYFTYNNVEYICCIVRDITERVKAEKDASFFRTLIEYTRDPVYVVSHTKGSRLVYVNEAACLHYGREREELLTLRTFDMDGTLDQEDIDELHDELKKNKSLHFETIHRVASGELVPVNVTANYLELDGDELAVGHFHDLSERRRIENELRQAHDELEKRIEERTVELRNANELLQHEMTVRKRTESVITARLRLLQFASTHTLDELLEATLDEAEVLTGSLIGFYHFLEADQKTLSLQNWSTRTKAEFCTAEGKGRHYDVSAAGVWADCIQERRPVIHNDYASLPHRKGMPPSHASVVRELVVPVFRGESIVAILGVGNKPLDYTPQDVETVSLLADLAWEIAERKRWEEALLFSRFCIDKAAIGIFQTDENGTIFSVNDYACASLGYSKDELCALSVFDIDPVITHEKMLEIKKMLDETGLATHETTHSRRDGTTFPVEITANLLEYQGKTFSISFVKDITERKRVEEALRKSRQMLMIVLDNFPGVVFWKNSNSLYLGCNKNFSLAAGLAEPSEIVGRSDHELPWKNDAEMYLADDHQVIQSGVPKLNIVETLLHADGRVAWFETSKVPLFDADGKVIAVLGVSNDITERKRAEEARRASEAEKSLILNSTMDYVVYHDPDMKIMWANWKAGKLANLPVEELTGRHCWEVLHRCDKPCEGCPVVLARDTGEPQQMEIRHFNGLILLMRAHPVKDDQGRLLGIVEHVSDITEQKRAEEALQKAHGELESRVRERTEQLTSLAAELSLAEERERRRIATELHDQVGQSLILSKIKLDSLSCSLPSESFGKLVGEIREYLNQSIEEIRSLTFQLSPPLLYEVGFEAAVEWLGEEFEEKYGFQVEFKDDGSKKPLNEETSVALYQMVRELLVNIAKHSKAKKVRISVAKVSDKIKIIVADDGSGFDGKKNMWYGSKKSGFGLFNIRHRIEYMGGELAIESEIEQGTRVSLLFPLKKKKLTNRKTL